MTFVRRRLPRGFQFLALSLPLPVLLVAAVDEDRGKTGERSDDRAQPFRASVDGDQSDSTNNSGHAEDEGEDLTSGFRANISADNRCFQLLPMGGLALCHSDDPVGGTGDYTVILGEYGGRREGTLKGGEFSLKPALLQRAFSFAAG